MKTQYQNAYQLLYVYAFSKKYTDDNKNMSLVFNRLLEQIFINRCQEIECIFKQLAKSHLLPTNNNVPKEDLLISTSTEGLFDTHGDSVATQTGYIQMLNNYNYGLGLSTNQKISDFSVAGHNTSLTSQNKSCSAYILDFYQILPKDIVIQLDKDCHATANMYLQEYCKYASQQILKDKIEAEKKEKLLQEEEAKRQEALEWYNKLINCKEVTFSEDDSPIAKQVWQQILKERQIHKEGIIAFTAVCLAMIFGVGLTVICILCCC